MEVVCGMVAFCHGAYRRIFVGVVSRGGVCSDKTVTFLGIGLMSPFFGVTLTMVIVLGACEVIFGLNYLFSKLARGFRAIKKVTTKQGGGLR